MREVRRVVVHAPERARAAIADAAWRAGLVPWDMSSGTDAPEGAIVVRVGDDAGAADLRLADAPPAELGPIAYPELRLLAGEEDEREGEDERWSRAQRDHDRAASNLPIAPEPCLQHRWYAPRAFVGRAAELAELDAWLASGPPVRVMRARGGVGKSALAWAWLERRLPDARWAGCLGYCLYQPGATFDGLVRTLAAYTAGDSYVSSRRDREELERAALEALRARPFLIVVDGLERALVAHHRLPGNEETAELHAFLDPRDGAFVRALAQGPSRLLATSRVLPSDLREGEGLAPGIEVRDLEGLDVAEIPALLAELDVDPAAEWVAPATRTMARLGHHVLLWRALAGVLREEPGALAEIVEPPEGEEDQVRPAELQERILEAAYRALSGRAAWMLARLAALRFPAEIEDVIGLSAPPLRLRQPPRPPRLGTTPAEAERALGEATELWQRRELRDRRDRVQASYAAWEVYRALARTYARLPEVRAYLAGLHADLRLLEERGLLQWDRAGNRYDLHPMVRAFVMEYFGEGDRRTSAAVIRTHLADARPEDQDQVGEVPELRRSLESYQALVAGGLLDVAAAHYHARLATPLRRLSAYPVIAELLVPLFPDGLHALPRLSSPHERSRQLTYLSDALAKLGRGAEARAMRALVVRHDLERRAPGDLSVSLARWGRSLEAGNFTRAALAMYALARRVAVARGSEPEEVLRGSALLACALGRWEEAAADLEALDFDASAYVRCCRAAMAFGRGEDPEPFLKDASSSLRLIGSTGEALAWNVLSGRIAADGGQYEKSASHCATAVTLARRTGADGSRAYAWLAVCLAELERPAEARAAIASAREEAARQGSRISAILGTAHWSLGDHDEAESLAQAGLREAWAGGPGYAWFDDLRVCEALMRKLALVFAAPTLDAIAAPRLDCEAELLAFVAELEAAKS